MSFHHTLNRLREAAKENCDPKYRGILTRRIVEARDLRELLHHFDRLDAEARAAYDQSIATQEKDKHISELKDQLHTAAALLKVKVGRKADCGRCIELEDQVQALLSADLAAAKNVINSKAKQEAIQAMQTRSWE